MVVIKSLVVAFALSACLWRFADGAITNVMGSDEQEYFPLSGGLSDGVEVKVIVKGADNTKAISMDFLTPDRSIAFKWKVDWANKKILRLSPMLDTPEVGWGGWPLQQGAVDAVFEFVKTRHSWLISIDNTRTPQFDFAHNESRVTGPITHLSVQAGYQDVEVVQTRPTCTQECNPDECMSDSGENSCSGKCFATIPSENPMFSQCTADVTTGTQHMHCCEGRNRSINFDDDDLVGKWAQVISDQEDLEALCTGFLAGTQREQCKKAAGLKVKISEKNLDAGTLKCDCPAFVLEADRMPIIPASALVLKPDKFASREFVSLSNDEYKNVAVDGCAAGANTCSTYRGIVSQGGPYGNVTAKFKFISMFTVTTAIYKGWYPWSQHKFNHWAREGASTTLLLVDQEIPLPSCEDRRYPGGGEWEDIDGKKCTAYASLEVCKNIGPPMPDDQIYNKGRDETGAANAGWTAYHMCCDCGGGNYTAPDGIPSSLDERQQEKQVVHS